MKYWLAASIIIGGFVLYFATGSLGEITKRPIENTSTATPVPEPDKQSLATVSEKPVTKEIMCKLELQTFVQSPQWQAEKLAALDLLISEINHQSKQVLVNFLQHTGLTTWYQGDIALHSLIPSALALNSAQDNEHILTLIRDSKYYELIEFYQQDRITHKWLYLTNPKTLVSPIATVLKSELAKDQAQLLNLLTSLIESGVPVYFVDLVVATELGLSESVIQLLQLNSQFELDVYFQYQGEIHNLFTLASAKEQLAVAEYWQHANNLSHHQSLELTLALDSFTQVMLDDRAALFNLTNQPIECQFAAAKVLAAQLQRPTQQTNTSTNFDSAVSYQTLVSQQLPRAQIIETLAADGNNQYKQQLFEYISKYPVDTDLNVLQFIESEIDSVDELADAYKLALAVAQGDINESLALIYRGVKILPDVPINAVATTNLAVVKALHQHGADLNFVTANNENAITRAASLQKYQILEYLVDSGINVKPTEYGYDPLDFVLSDLMYESKQQEKLFELTIALLQAGAIIETSHQQTLALLLKSKPDIAERLIDIHPELANL